MDVEDDDIPVGLMAWCTDCGAPFQFIEIEDNVFELDNQKDAIESLIKEARCGKCFGTNMLEHDPEIDSEIGYYPDKDEPDENPSK